MQPLPPGDHAAGLSYIDMGGMFTVLKVRESPDSADPNGFFEHSAGSVAARADAAQLRADGIDV